MCFNQQDMYFVNVAPNNIWSYIHVEYDQFHDYNFKKK
jgi:hypothetical protein